MDQAWNVTPASLLALMVMSEWLVIGVAQLVSRVKIGTWNAEGNDVVVCALNRGRMKTWLSVGAVTVQV